MECLPYCLRLECSVELFLKTGSDPHRVSPYPSILLNSIVNRIMQSSLSKFRELLSLVRQFSGKLMKEVFAEGADAKSIPERKRASAGGVLRPLKERCGSR